MTQTGTLTGTAALARGAWEAGASFACASKDTRTAALLQALRAHPSMDVREQPDDARALDAALDAARSGRRAALLVAGAACAGLAERLAACAGEALAAGLLVVVADDPMLPGDGDARHAAWTAKLPLLAPWDPRQAMNFAKLAFSMSERHALPVLLLLPPAVAEACGPCPLSDPEEKLPPRKAAAAGDAAAAGAPAPAAAAFLEQQMAAIEQWAATAFDVNPVVIGSPELGIVASGAAAAAARRAQPGASLLTLGLLHPLPRKLVSYFASLTKRLAVLEDGAPFLEEQLRAAGLSIATDIAAAAAPVPAAGPAAATMPVVPRRLGVRSFDEMLALVKTLPKRRVAIAGGQNLAALHAGIECVELGLGTPVYVGPSSAIRQLAREKFPDFDIDGVEIVEAADDQAIAVTAVALVRSGEADILLKGGVNTPTLMRAALSSTTGLRAGNLLSDTFVFEYPDEDGIRLVMITDGGLNLQPTAQQKIDILKNAVVVAHALGNPDPRVGMLAASETVSPGLPASMDAAITMHMNRAGYIGGCIVEGPIALDVAVSRKAAAIKGTASDVAGQADILVAASIDTANALAKSTTYFAGYRLAHVIVGATAPILIASRSDSSDAKLLSVALGSLMAKYFEEQRSGA